MMYARVLALLSAWLLSTCMASEANTPDSDVKVVLITGCSSGIGYATALAFAADPRFVVYATMRNTDSWVGPVDPPNNLFVEQMDVTSEASIDTTVRNIHAKHGAIHIVINNAGFGLAGCLETVSIAEGQELFNVNVWGVVRVLQAVLPLMRAALRGHVINISSTSGLRGIPCMDMYSGSKFALEGITDSMRYSLLPFNVSVTNVNAGPVRTSFTNRFGDATVGGLGTRRLSGDEALVAYTARMVSSLSTRMNSAEAQDATEVAKIVLDVALLALDAKHPMEVPFNLATSLASNKVLEGVRVNPSGWGGVYDTLASSVPTLTELLSTQRDEL